MRNVLTGIDGSSMFDTAARTSAYGESLYKLLVSRIGVNQLMGLRCAYFRLLSLYRPLTFPIAIPFTLNTLVIQVATLPLGKGMAYLLPKKRFNTFGYVWSLNPGPFNVKEHTVITAMGMMTWTTSFVLSTYIVQEVNYGQQLSYAYKIINNLSTQLIGIGFAGVFHRFLIYPASMIYPGTLVSCSLTNTLHRTWGVRESRHVSRSKFFVIVMLCAMIWYFVPGFLFTGLSIFSWVCWIAPTNAKVNTVFGSLTGMGMGLLTFDWSMISIIGNPLVSPVRPLHNFPMTRSADEKNSGGPKSTSTCASFSSRGSLHPSFTVRVSSRSPDRLPDLSYSHQHVVCQVPADFFHGAVRQHGSALRPGYYHHQRHLRRRCLPCLLPSVSQHHERSQLRHLLRHPASRCGSHLPYVLLTQYFSVRSLTSSYSLVRSRPCEAMSSRSL